MFGWLYLKKVKAPDPLVIMGEEFKRLQEAFLVMQRNLRAIEGLVSELSSKSFNHAKNLGTLFTENSDQDLKMAVLEDQFKFFKRKQSKEKKCQKLPLKK